MTTMKKHIQIILSSTRAARIGDQIVDYVKKVMEPMCPSTFTFEIVDLKDWDLPLGMPYEASIPKFKQYTQPHTFAWSEKISQGDGFVFVLPQYNGSYPATVKNAIDYLYQE
ncbi:hypothetical protein CYY_000193, partial [Polysphondylium violaceum]